MKQNVYTKNVIPNYLFIQIFLYKNGLPYPLHVNPQDGLSENGVATFYLKFKLV